MELVFIVKHLTRGIDLKEGGASAFAKTATKISQAVIEFEVALLTEHTHGGEKQFLRRNVFLLVYGDDTIREVEPSLQFLVVANGKHGIWSTEGS